MRHRALQLAFGVGTVCLWEALVRMNGSTVIPAPSVVAAAALELAGKGILAQDLADSLKRVLIGFSLASVCGIVLGFLMGLWSLMRVAVSPLLEFLRPIPPIAWIPLAMTIFGLGDQSACFVIFIGAFYPVFTNTLLGVRQVPKLYLEAAKSLGCSQWRRITSVIWPSALPSVFAGLKVGLGFGWMCVVAAEMIAANSGLGYEIQLNRQLLRLDRVVVGMLLIGLVGFLMQLLLTELEKHLLPWESKNAVDSSDTAAANEQSSSGDSGAAGVGIMARAAAESAVRGGASVRTEHIQFAHAGGATVIDDLSTEVGPGEVFCLLGPSGCGKTTLLRLIASLQEPSSGKVLIDGSELAQQQDDVTMVFQNTALFPWRTALGNICFALESRHAEKRTLHEEAAKYLSLVGLPEKANRYPHQLSGGQQQRVALARALAYKPRVLLMDEPFAALDSQTRESLQEDLSAIVSTMGITVIFVTHDIREAVFLADRVAVMSSSGGRLLDVQQIKMSQPREDAFRYSSEFSSARLTLWNELKGVAVHD